MCQIMFFTISFLYSCLNLAYPLTHSERLQEIRENIDKIESAANSLDDQINVVKVKARAASLVWRIDRDSSKLRFSALWQWVHSNLSNPVALSKAKIEILSQLYPLDPDLVDLLLGESQKSSKSTESESLSDRLKGQGKSANLRTEIASRVLDDNPQSSATLMIDEIKHGYTYQLHSAILRLAAKDQTLGNKVVAQLLSSIDESEPAYSIVALQHLFTYFFDKSSEGNLMVPTNRDQAIRDYYLRLSIRVLERSLTLGAGNRSPTDQRLVEMSQSVLAVQLKSIIGKVATIEPENRKKVYSLSERLSRLVPPELSGIFGQEHTVEPNSRGYNVSSLAGIEPAVKVTYDELVKRAGMLASIREMIRLKEYAEALTQVLSIEDRQQQIILLNDLRHQVTNENETHFASYITGLTIGSLADLAPSERKAEIMLQLMGGENRSRTSQLERQFWVLFSGVIDEVNLLPTNSRLASSEMFRNAVINAVKIDKTVALNKISDIRLGVFNLMAMLAVNESLLNQALAGVGQSPN